MLANIIASANGKVCDQAAEQHLAIAGNKHQPGNQWSTLAARVAAAAFSPLGISYIPNCRKSQGAVHRHAYFTTARTVAACAPVASCATP